jgi:hypothetical protein
VLLGLLAHVRWREQGVRAGLPLSIVCFAVGLAGGESALGALAYLLAYELTAAPGPWRARALALLPVAALGVLYVGVYRAVGAGAFGSGIYVDPMREPLLFLAQAPPKALALVGALLLGSTADLWLLLQPARPALVLAGVLALLLVGALLRRLWPALEAEERRGLRWLGLGSALSLIPVLATFPLNRLLLMPSVGGSAVLAAALWHGWRAAHDRFARLGARLLFLTTVVLGLLGWAGAWGVMRIGGDEQIRTAMETRLSEEALAGEVFLLVAPDPVTAIYLPLVRLWNGRPLATTWITLSFAPCAHRLTRTAPDTLELEVLDGRMLETVFEQLLRSPAFPIAEGATVRLSGATLTVVHLDRALPQRIRVQFDAPLEGGAVTVAWFEHGTLAPFPLPAVGQSVELPNIALF